MMRHARTVTVVYDDGTVDTYADVAVRDETTEPKGDRPGTIRYAVATLPIERKVPR